MPLYVGFITPDDRPQVANRYERLQYQFVAPASGSWTVRAIINDDAGNTPTAAGLGGNLNIPPWPEVRIRVSPWIDGDEATSPWITSTNGVYDWTFTPSTLPDSWHGKPVGNHILQPQVRASGGGTYIAHCLGALFDVGPVHDETVEQWVWASSVKLEHVYGDVPYGWDQPVAMLYPGLPTFPLERNYPVRHPTVASWGGKTMRSYSTAPTATTRPLSDFWSSVYGAAGTAGLFRGWTRKSTHRVTTAMKQQYHYYEQTDRREPLVDGPKGIAKAGHAMELRFEPVSTSFYGLAPQGRLMYFHLDGRLITVVGWRNKQTDTFNPPATLASTWTDLPPYWQDANNTGMLEFLGDMSEVAAAGWPINFNAPQGFDFISNNLSGARRRRDFAITDFQNDQLIGVELVDQPDGTLKRRCYPLFKWAAGSRPWGCAYNPSDGWIYVSLFGGNAARTGHKIVRVHPVTRVSEDVWVSNLKPTFAEAGIPAWGELPASQRAKFWRPTWCASGVSGVGSLPFMQGLRFDSTGKLIVMNRYGFALAAIDLTQPIASRQLTMFSFPFQGFIEDNNDLRDIWFDVNVDGTVGALDDIFVTAWGQQNNVVVSRTGAWKGPAMPEGSYRNLFDGPIGVDLSTIYAGTVDYPSGIAVGLGQMAISGTGTTQSIRVVSLKLPTDPLYDRVKYGNGLHYYRTGGNNSAYPSFTLSHGTYFQGGVADRDVTVLAAMTDADLTAYIQAGMGTSVPRPLITGSVLSDLIYFIRWQGRLASGPMRPIGPTTGPVVTPSPGTWVAYPSSSHQAALGSSATIGGQGPAELGSNATPVNAIIEAWGGAIYDESRGVRGVMQLHGGGHQDGYISRLTEFDLDAGTWDWGSAQASARVITTVDTSNKDTNPDGTPSAIHSYNGLLRLPTGMLRVGGVTWSSAGIATRAVWRFARTGPGVGTWTRDPDADASLTSTSMVLGYDATSGKVIAYTASKLFFFTPGAAWGGAQSFEGAGLSLDAFGCFDTLRRKLWVFDLTPHPGKVRRFNATGSGQATFEAGLETLTGVTLPGGSGIRPSADYHPATDSVLVWYSGQNIYAINPATLAVSLVTMSGANPGAPVAAGTYGRFRVTRDGYVVVIPTATSDVFVGAPVVTTPPPPTSHIGPSFLSINVSTTFP